MITQLNKKQLKQFKNQAQEGRSMIEMLGVLAIIAILSIGGIVGYKLAMNYYQADQIANEINLMRNDLKVKYALGNEELLLGDPYDDTPADEHYSGHLSTQYDRYPVDYDCIRKDKAEFYNCRETDAYYIKVGNVSKGVCKPLTTLLNGMDGLMYMEINKEVYKENDLCSSDEANEFYIQFDAEDVNGNYDSNRPEGWCGKNEDCEGLSTPVCDKDTHECVECVGNGNCSAPRSVCDVANHECVECIDNTDCSNNKPVCNVDSGDCEACPPETPKWNGEENRCVECLTYKDCTDSEKPKCEESTHKCEPCPPKSVFYEGECYEYECRSNEDCNPDGGFENYCHGGQWYHTIENCSQWSDNPAADNFSGTCRSVNTDLLSTQPVNIEGTDYWGSNVTMNWWTSCRFCAARKHVPDNNCEVGDNPSFMPDKDKIPTSYEIGLKFFEMYGIRRDLWLRNSGGSCTVYWFFGGGTEKTNPYDTIGESYNHALCLQ